MASKATAKRSGQLAHNLRGGPGGKRARVAVNPYRPYRHRGVLIPFNNRDDNNQWSSDSRIQEEGFIFVDCLSPNVFVVQSVQTGRIFINKVMRADNREDPDLDCRRPDEQAEELRISTAPQAEYRLPGARRVGRIPRTYFSELALWQDIGNGTYSLYFDYYNGGTLGQLEEQYISRQLPIPEHFIWHVFLTLIEAVRYLHTGCLPGEDNEPHGWVPIHHRDIAPNNIFLHYAERPASEVAPPEGFQTNAFPEIVLGGFGHGAVEGDDARKIGWGRWNEIGETAPWQDTYAVFSTIKRLCNEINDYIQGDDMPYSADLLTLLEAWEYGNCANSSITESQLDANGVSIPNRQLIPDLNDMVDMALPLARRVVRRYRRPGGVMPVDWYRQLDVSWTKPKSLMPYEWWPLPNDDEGENIVYQIIYGGDEFDNDDDVYDDDDNRDDGSQSENDKDSDGKDIGKQDNNSQSGKSENSNIQITGGSKKRSSSPDSKKKGSDTKSNTSQGIKNQDGDNKPSGSQDSNSQAGKSPGGDDPDDDGISDGSPVSDIPEHECPQPNLETHLAKLQPLLRLEEDYPDFREPSRLVMLVYGLPSMSEIQYFPDRPAPDLPDSPPPTSSDDDDDDTSRASPSIMESSSTHPPTSTDSGSSLFLVGYTTKSEKGD
ncbi:hypothetical protein F4823DRAFT_561977 [Ustulina deusta]|nr:hypothetical protein F4823DRAFT_561977 [Ustulina deusta]